MSIIYYKLWFIRNKKFHGSWEKCLRAGFFTPVEGRRSRWTGQPPDWGRWADSPGPLRGHTTGLRWAHHGCSARAMVRGLEMRVPDGSGARSLAGFGWESFAWVRCTWVRGWGLPMESIPGRTGDGKFDGETFLGGLWMFFPWGAGEGKRNSRTRLSRRFHRTTRVPNSPVYVYIIC